MFPLETFLSMLTEEAMFTSFSDLLIQSVDALISELKVLRLSA